MYTQTGFEDDYLLFEPDHKTLDTTGVSAFELLVTVDKKGCALIPLPLHNYQGSCVTLQGGSPLGLVRRCDSICGGQPQVMDSPSDKSGTSVLVSTVSEDPAPFERLVKTLDLHSDKLKQLLGLEGLLHEYSDVFALTDQELGCTNIVHHSIDTGDHRPIKQQPYRTAIAQRDTIRQMVDQMQSQGIVKPSQSPWDSPVVLVPKKDGSVHFCVDYRKLNSITQRDVFPLPRVDDILDTLHGTKFFTSLDLASGYWQIELESDACTKSAFTTYNGLY